MDVFRAEEGISGAVMALAGMLYSHQIALNLSVPPRLLSSDISLFPKVLQEKAKRLLNT